MKVGSLLLSRSILIMHEQYPNKKKQLLSIIFLVIIILLTAYLYLRDYSINELITTLKSININFLILGLGMMFLFVNCEAINIYMIMSSLKTPLPYYKCLQYSCIGFYFSSITPSASGGQPVQVYYMRQHKIPVSVSTITIFFIVFVYQIAMVFWGIVISVFRYDITSGFASSLWFLLLYGTIINVGAIAILFLLMFSKNIVPKILIFFINFGKKLKLIKNSEGILDKIDKSMILYKEKANILKNDPILFFKVFLVTIIQMAALNIIPYLTYRSFGYDSSFILDLFAYQSLLTISTSAIPLPGAEGVTQGGFLRVFRMFFPESEITSAMLLNRIISFYIPLLLCFIVYFFVHIYTFRKRGDKVDRQ
ncbi:MAG: flippase-like domain-containing protein [Anaerolineaceae bacterium]|nr:MAG: flippase-like domain-containing protein [Anaerolineaceae bacterium]